MKELLKNRADFVLARENALQFIQQMLGVKKISKKLFDFYMFDFTDFESELVKQKIKLNLEQKEEWFNWFKNKKELLSDDTFIIVFVACLRSTK